MAEILVKIEVPSELEKAFELALSKVISQLVRRVEFSISEDILSKSNLTDEQAIILAGKLKERVAKKHEL